MNLWIQVAYLVAAVCFILGLGQLSSPKTALRGNQTAAAGMVIAIAATIPLLHFTTAGLIVTVLAIAIGAPVGAISARQVHMTAMPQMVAAFNGVGGGAAALVSLSELLSAHFGSHPGIALSFPSIFALVVGGISFAGSAVAFAKLQGIMTGTPITYPGQQIVNAVLALAIVVLAVLDMAVVSTPAYFVPILVLALIFGVAFVLPIGGADMPVVISLLNAFTGLSVAATGFVLNNFAMLVAGTLVGASGTLLTMMMSEAMGRSLTKTLFGAFGQTQAGPAGAAATAEGKSVRAGTPEDVGTMLAYARKVIIVPGYGLAVAQGQHALKELADELEKRGVEVEYAIHPVAGRMPGHMNVLLAEANVPYDQLKEMDDINGEFPSTDVALVVGANDVVNPAAKNTPGSPIYGMPILNVDQAKNIVFMKRSMRPGFAGIDNELLYDPKTIMLFGDAKDSLTKLVGAVKTA